MPPAAALNATQLVPIGLVLLLAGLPIVSSLAPERPVTPPERRGVDPQVRLRVPEEQAIPLFTWLYANYGAEAPRVVRPGCDRVLTGAVADRNRLDVWFDTPELRVLQHGGGVCLRREAPAGQPKNERAHLLLRWPADQNGREPLAVDFDALTVGRRQPTAVPPTTLIEPRQLELAQQLLRDLDLEPLALRPLVAIEQERHGLQLADDGGALLLLSLSKCSCRQDDTALRWYEFDIVLDRARLAASGDGGDALQRLAGAIAADVRAAFPMLTAEQELPFQRVFGELEQTSWLPLRAIAALRLDPQEFKAMLLLLFAALVGGSSLLLAARRRRLQRPQPRVQPA